MARIAGVNLPKGKKVKIGLTYIYGVGKSTAAEILDKSKVDSEKKVYQLSYEEIKKLQAEVKNYKIEGELKRAKRQDIQRLKKIDSYRGYRHRKGLPVRGQRTRTNARTRKGRKNR